MRQDSHDLPEPTSKMNRSRAESTDPSFGGNLPTSGALTVLNTISRQIGTSLTNSDVLRTICQTLVETLGLDYITVLRVDVSASYASVAAEHPVRLGQTDKLPLEHFGIYQHLQTSSNPVVIEDVQTAADMLGPNQVRFQALNLHTIAVVPLLVQGDLIGGLLLATSDPKRVIKPRDLHIAQTVAIQIALSLRTAEFFTEIQRRSNQLERIAAFGQLVTSSLDQMQILRHVMEVVPNLIPADQVSVAFYTLEQNRMRLFESHNGSTPQETSLTAAGSSVEEVVHHRNPILIGDLSTSTYTDHQRLSQFGMQAAIIAPLRVSGRMLGAVTVAHKSIRTYTPTDLTLLQQISNQIAIALENANIFNTARERAAYEETLSEITSHLQEQSDLRMILQQTMSDFGKVVGASQARVRLQITPSEFDLSKLFEPKE
jgi:GAF domain-containing protein